MKKEKTVPTIIIKGKITKGYEHWLAAYDALEEHRDKDYGIKTLYKRAGFKRIRHNSCGDANPESSTMSISSE